MLQRCPSSLSPFPIVLAVALLVPVASLGQTDVPRTADGRPDPSGVWNFSTATSMQRPEELAGKERLTAEEAAEYEAQLAERRRAGDSTSPTASLEARVSYEQAIWFEQGAELAEYRTSLIANPPNGRIPAMRLEAVARGLATRVMRGRPAEGPEDRGLSERCLMGFNSGPPMTPSVYNNNVQLFLTPDYFGVLNEMVHNARLVPLDSRPHVPASLRQWAGDSRASWDGDTLVVETTNFLRETSFGGSSANLHLVERCTRTGPDTLTYTFTATDPTTWGRTVDGRGADDEGRRAGVRVRLARRQLLDGQLADRRARGAGGGGRRAVGLFVGIWGSMTGSVPGPVLVLRRKTVFV